MTNDNTKAIELLKKAGFDQQSILDFCAKEDKITKLILAAFETGKNVPKEMPPELQEFHYCLQGISINSLVTANVKKTSVKIDADEFNDSVELFINDNFILRVANYSKFKEGGIPPYVLQVLDCFLITFTNNRNREASVELPLTKYMELRGLKSKSAARKQVLEAMELLQEISFDVIENEKGRWIKSGAIRICGGTSVIVNGIIRFNFNIDFYPLLLGYPVMLYSKETLRMNTREHPYSYYISRYLDLNYRLNSKKERLNTIKMSTLLTKLPNMPSYEYVKSNLKGGVYTRIILPVLRDLSTITHVKYEIWDENNEPVEDPEKYYKGAKGYGKFVKSKLILDYTEFPKLGKKLIIDGDVGGDE